MNIKKKMKQKVTELAYQMYDFSKKDVEVTMQLLPKKTIVTEVRHTKQTIKWHSKIR